MITPEQFIAGTPLTYHAGAGDTGPIYTATFKRGYGTSYIEVLDARGSCVSCPIVGKSAARAFVLNINRPPI